MEWELCQDQTITFIMENGKMVSHMVKVSKNLKKRVHMKGILKRVKEMVLVNTYLKMEVCMKDNGRMIRNMEVVS